MKLLFWSLFLAIPFSAMSQKPIMQWDFENIRNRYAIENSSNLTDTIEGNYEVAEGVSGKGLIK